VSTHVMSVDEETEHEVAVSVGPPARA
jgi:hypothetical protein